jgi:hypothetical protein
MPYRGRRWVRPGWYAPASWFIDFEIRIISGGVIELVGPSVDDGGSIKVINGGHDAILEFLFGCEADMAQHRAGELGEEAFDILSHVPCLGAKANSKRPVGCSASQALVSFELCAE